MAGIALPRTRTRTESDIRSFNTRRFARRGALYLVLTLGALYSAFPFVWMLLTSLKGYADATHNPPTWIPSSWHFENYRLAWQAAPFARYFVNTFLIAGCVVAGTTVTSVLAAYAFARLDFYGRNVLFILFLSTLMIPFEAIIIPNFILVKNLHLLNTYGALIVPWTASVFAVFLLRQFMLQLPQDLFDSANLDGAGHLRTLWSIVLPLCKGPLAAIALFAFLGSWNSLLWPLIATNSQNLRPIQLGLSTFVTENGTQPHLLMAASAFTIAPIVVLYFFCQKQFIEGFASSGIKGG
jgi:multiple sugar transport system permease protein